MEKLSLPAVLDSLAGLRAYARRAAAEAGVDAERAYGLQLAVDEIATNIISYGLREGGAAAEITIGSEVRDGALLVTLEDQAPEFDPRTRPVPSAEDLARPLEERTVGGLGIYLARQAVDHFDYRREGGRNVNTFAVRIGDV